MLVWDETDALTVLEVLPEEERDGIWHKYTVEKDGIRLELVICQYDGDVFFNLVNIKNNNPILSMKLIDCEGMRRVKDNTGEFLEFAPAKCFGTRYDGESSIPYGVRVQVNPGIMVSLYG